MARNQNVDYAWSISSVDSLWTGGSTPPRLHQVTKRAACLRQVALFFASAMSSDERGPSGSTLCRAMTCIRIARGWAGRRGRGDLFGRRTGVLSWGALSRCRSWYVASGRGFTGRRFSGGRFASTDLRNGGGAASLLIRGRGAASSEEDAYRLDNPAKLAAAFLAYRQRIIAKALPPFDYLATSLACIDIGWHDSSLRGGNLRQRESPK